MMKTVINNATIVNNGESHVGSLLVSDGRIERIVLGGEIESQDGCCIVDATGMYLLPGVIDGHVHFRDSNGGVPGTGIIDFKEVICILEAMGYDKWIAFEVDSNFCEYERGAVDTYKYIRPILEQAYYGR